MEFIARQTRPQQIEINGVKYPAIWSFKAIAEMESYTETSHLYSLARFNLGIRTGKDITGAIIGMISAAGVTCKDALGADALPQTVEQSLNPADEDSLFEQIRRIIADQGDQPDGDPKNA